MSTSRPGARQGYSDEEVMELARCIKSEEEVNAMRCTVIRPGATFRELTFQSWIPDPDVYRHYTSQFHGVGLCDEYPAIFFPEDWESAGYDGVVEPGMVLAVESYVGRKDGGEGVKFEEQLVTDTGPVTLSTYPLGLTKG